MGNPLSSQLSDTEFQAQIKSLGATDLNPEHSEELNTFLRLSQDFTHFFTSCTLNDFRNLRKTKPMSLIYLMSHVSKALSIFKSVPIISDRARSPVSQYFSQSCPSTNPNIPFFPCVSRLSRSCMMQRHKSPQSRWVVTTTRHSRVPSI